MLSPHALLKPSDPDAFLHPEARHRAGEHRAQGKLEEMKLQVCVVYDHTMALLLQSRSVSDINGYSCALGLMSVYSPAGLSENAHDKK